MTTRKPIAILLSLVLTASPLTSFGAEQQPDFNFEELMEGVEFDLNEMQASISLEENASAIDYAHKLEQAFKKMEGFFAGWDYAEDAVLSTQQYQERARRVVELIEGGDYNQAYEVSVEFSDHCKACHDNYKPLPL
ncbi:MAG: hypothetical protein LBE21_05190 [Pseudomonadales bacterium]|jgi:hypothetical protein|nr:hypothetical protein [Pseudomonadales bacterium]